MIDAPVVAFRSGRGIVSNAHELGLTMAAAYKLWPNTDLMIGIGTRMELPTSGFAGRSSPTGLKSIRIDIDPSEMRRLTPDAAVVADAKAGTHALLAAVRKAGYSKSSGRRAAIREATAAAGQEIQRIQPQMAYLKILREVLPANAIVTDELSQVGFASWYGFPVYDRALLSPRAIRAPSDRAFRPRSAPRSPIRTDRWWRSPATADSCSACRSFRPPSNSASAW